MEFFSQQTYIRRRSQLKSQLSSGLLFFMGNQECGMNYRDNAYRFRQDSTFLYYFGIQLPDLFGVIDLDNNTEIIFGDELTIDHVVWMGEQPSLGELAQRAGVANTAPLKDLTPFIEKQKDRKWHFLPAYRAEHELHLLHFFGIHPSETAQAVSIPFITAVAEQRNIKSAEEIEQIEMAVNTTARMHRAAMRYARAGMTEAQVAAKVYEALHHEGMELSFPVIATVNGQILHNHYHGNTLQEGQLFLLDAGAETALGYAGDMSSTFPVAKKFTDLQKEVYSIALHAHNSALEALKPGVHFRDVHLLAARCIFDGLKSVGLTKGNTEDALVQGAHALFFPCGLGHLMGLDVHDMENLGEQWVGYCGVPKSKQFGLKSLRLGRELKPGFVITIEPGIYFIPKLIDLWQQQGLHNDYLNYDAINRYRNFGGIRNEEDVLITETSYRILGEALAKSIEDVEAERAYS